MGFERHGREVVARHARLLVKKEVVEHFPAALRRNAARQFPQSLNFGNTSEKTKVPASIWALIRAFNF